jgi:chemotaxis protein histidine kinase CheA
LLAAVVLLTGCDEAARKYQTPGYVPSANELTRIAVEWPDGDPLKPTAQAVALERFATAQAFESEADAARATSDAAERQAQQRYVILTAESQQTAEAHQREMEKRNQWATQQAANATQVAQATAMAVAVEATREARHARATATERAARATGTAVVLAERATATKQAVNEAATMTRVVGDTRQTATAGAHTATAVMAQATMTRQAEKREQTMGVARDYGLPILLILVAGAVAVVGLNVLRDYLSRPVQYDRSLLGDFQPLAFRDGQGGWTLVDLDRQPGHVTRVLPSGEIDAPQVRSAGQEERTTARDQLSDMHTRPQIGSGRPSTPPPELPMESPPRAPAPGLRSVRVLRKIEHVDQSGYLPRPLLESIEADWEVEE